MALSSDGEDTVGEHSREKGVTLKAVRSPGPQSLWLTLVAKWPPGCGCKDCIRQGNDFSSVPSGLSGPEYEGVISSPPVHTSPSSTWGHVEGTNGSFMLYKYAFRDQNPTFGNDHEYIYLLTRNYQRKKKANSCSFYKIIFSTSKN